MARVKYVNLPVHLCFICGRKIDDEIHLLSFPETGKGDVFQLHAVCCNKLGVAYKLMRENRGLSTHNVLSR